VPTRKQRRRQQKERRHEYEFVYVDDEGQEVEVDPAELKADRETRQTTKASSARRQPASRSRRTIQPPSLQRVLKRGLLFAPVMYLTLSLIGRGEKPTTGARVLETAMLLAFFLPFSYVMDKIAYRTYQRRLAGPGDDAKT
jgi:hypothetical protein